MGRKRSYDEHAVLAGAMHAFRRKGYQAATILDLEAATGLKAGSLYNSFGDKAGLFDAAFAHYNRAVLQSRIERYAAEAASLRGLRELFLSLLHEPSGEAFGCLITNSAVEFGGEGPIHPGAEEGLQVLTRVFADRLNGARRDGALRADVDPERAAVKLLVLYQGVLVLVRARRDKASLERLIVDEFANLEVHHDA
jgi:TetR/AcrR family transcriptional repressor of nem operon